MNDLGQFIDSVAFDEPGAFGVRLRYSKDGEVATYERRIAKVNAFQAGQVPPGFDPSGLEVTYPVVDNAREFTSIIEARAPGTETILHRGVAVALKAGGLAEMTQGSF